jgi:hypothetical protein
VAELEKNSWMGQDKKKHKNMVLDTPLPTESFTGDEGSQFHLFHPFLFSRKK